MSVVYHPTRCRERGPGRRHEPPPPGRIPTRYLEQVVPILDQLGTEREPAGPRTVARSRIRPVGRSILVQRRQRQQLLDRQTILGGERTQVARAERPAGVPGRGREPWRFRRRASRRAVATHRHEPSRPAAPERERPGSGGNVGTNVGMIRRPYTDRNVVAGPWPGDTFSALGGTRTPNLLIRSQMLYPIELRAQSLPDRWSGPQV